MTAVDLVTRARSNWRGAIWVAVAVLAVGLGIGASIVGRIGVAPSDAERTARDFVAAWNHADYKRAYTYLDSTIAADDFVKALSGSAAPIRDARVERVVRQDDRESVIAYSASIPDASAAVTGVVVANDLRYASSCVDANARGARYVRVTDNLVVDRGADGAWKISFRRDRNSPVGAAAVGLAYDLSPRTFYQHLSGGVDPKSAAYDDQVIADALQTYQRDVGALPTEDPTQVTPDAVRLRVKSVAAACGSG